MDTYSLIHTALKIDKGYSKIKIGNTAIGNGDFAYIAGPCSVESYEQILATAQEVKKAGATLLRGGAYKPRTSPYDFQGLGKEGLRLLAKAGKASGLPVVTEIVQIGDLDFFEGIDVIQVGARNMQNFPLLKQLGKCNKPILLKRGFANTIRELLLSAEYIMAEGNENVILCERGIRTFETETRNTLDISSVPVIKQISHLPIIVDPSHATGSASLILPVSLAAAAAGCDGLMIEVHPDPKTALCDGEESITPEEFKQIVLKTNNILPCCYKPRGINI